jgi:sulfonate transport system substrate-binding protein
VLVLQKEGLTVNDIDLINLSQADIATAIVNGNIDAAAVWEPIITKLESEGAVRVLTDGTGIKKGILVIIATNDFAGKHREQTKALLRAYQRGAQFIESNPKEAAQLIAGDVNLPADLMLSAGLIKTPVNIDAFVDVDLARESGIK